ncbi:MAG TPA: M28 family peptidase [Gemmatimonadales bacterium]|nr:M28 family peptidase [Gemmatimonadales bacterium]
MLLVCRVPAAAQTGFPPTATEPALERQLLAVPDTAARAMTRDLSRAPHMAGTRAQAATRDYVLKRFGSFGLDTWTKSYTVYLPQPRIVRAWAATGPGARYRAITLDEPKLSGVAHPLPPFNAYSGNADTSGDVVYANYGLVGDYRTLDSLGVSVRGKIVLARYGRSFRGIKAREAEARGAAGLVLYSDPEDDGFVRGPVYPTGPMRPPGGIQRGSVLNENGDPTTPGYASVPGAHRVPEDSMALPRIPVIPMGYGNAAGLLRGLTGTEVPGPWQGGLPFHYHAGPGPVRLRLEVVTERGERAMHPIWDAFGMIRGTTFPDEWVVLGAHRDAWGPGAVDNGSGTVAVLEAARALGALARAGERPARSVIFASWDAEEWALIGSTEWVEELEDSLRSRVVAYINEDDVTNGMQFEGTASPCLKPFVREVAQTIPDPEGPGSVYDRWLARMGDPGRLGLGDPGGGSDFVPFTHHLGVPMLSVAFAGSSGVYHSAYDDLDWVERFGDPTWRAHRALGQFVGLAALRLANATVLPFDYAAAGTELAALATDLDAGILARGWTVSTGELRNALTALARAGVAFATVRDSALGGALGPARAAQANRWLIEAERRLTRAQGLVGRPWYRSLEFAPDVDDGYGTMAFPSVAEAVRYGDPATTARELADLVAHVAATRDAVERAAQSLR